MRASSSRFYHKHKIECFIFIPTLIGFEEASSHKSVQYFRSFSMVTGGGGSGGAMVLGKLPVPGRPTFLIIVGQGPIALAVGAGGDGLDIFTLICPFSSFSLSLGDGPI